MSLHIAKLIKAPLLVASAVLAIHIGAATAADSNGDIQQQMRELLSGTTPSHFVPQSGLRDGRVTTRSVDSQEFVQQLLRGAAAYGGGGAETSKHSEFASASGKAEPHKRPVAYDMQASVREGLLGQPHASDVARLAARPTR